MLLQTAPVLALLSLFIVTGFRGVDLGLHWDEVDWHIKPAQKMAATGIFLPRAYIYPSLSEWLVLLPSVPATLDAVLATGGNPNSMQAAMTGALGVPDYLLTVRRLFIVLSALAILWVYCAALALRRPWWEALIAASALGLSWEFAYHARWVANDCILAQFSALALFMIALVFRTRRPLWLYLAAVAAGLGTGAKYPGVVLLVPVLGSSLLAFPYRRLRAQALRLVALCATAFAAYLVTTPGTALDLFKFIEHGRIITNVYNTGFYGFSATSGWHHARLVLTYFAMDYFSPYRVVAVPLFLSVFLGAIAWVRSDRRVAAVLVCFPFIFLMFFCSKYRVVTVRNYMFIVPFLGLLVARGLAEIFHRFPQVWVRWSLRGALTVAMMAQGLWLIRAAESIRHADLKVDVQRAVAFVASQADRRFRLSKGVRDLAKQQGLTLPPNVTERPETDLVVFIARAEGPHPRRWTTNDPWLTEAVFGPREVNFNWYSSWAGKDRVVAMTVAKAKAAGIPMAQ
jgi:hypothetical protein